MTRPDSPPLLRIARHLEGVGGSAFALYKGPCFERRVAVRLRARGQRDFADYAKLLDDDVAERRHLVSALAIGVTSFFRNPTAWRRLGALVDASGPQARFRAWSAGCSTGEEAYSIAMVLAGTGRAGSGGDLGDWSVEGGDLDERGLAVARRARYPARVVADIEAVGPSLGRLEDDVFAVAPDLVARTRFNRDDVTVAHSRGPYDLIACRNLLIYFGEEGQRRVLQTLCNALGPGGLLLLGRAELAAFHPALPLVPADGRERIYRRVA